MRKILQALALGAVLLLSTQTVAQAAVVTNTTDQLFNAVGETSTTLRVNTPRTKLSVFVSGTYEDVNTVVLQREVGSSGSGAFEDVLTVTSGTANARVVSQWQTGPNPSSYRLRMTATGTGAVVAYLTDKPVTARTITQLPANESRIVLFDDFYGGLNDGSLTVVNPSLYVATQGADSQGTIAARIVSAGEEGVVQLVSGDALAGSEVCLSMVDEVDFGAIASDGEIIFEVRLAAAQVDGLTYMTLQGQECTAAASVDVLIDIDSGVVGQVDGSNVDMAGIARQDEATDTDDWQAFSSLIDVEGANALEVPLGVVGVAGEYDTLRVEIDTVGNAYFFINGDLVHAEALAVTASQRLIPAIVTAETAAGGGTVTIDLDYLLFITGRPSS